MAQRGDHQIVAEHDGVVRLTPKFIKVRREERSEEHYVVPKNSRLRVNEGDRVEPGEQLTEGAQNPHRILSILGLSATQSYLLDEIQRVYRSQGVSIADKHIEVIIRQMLGKVRILRPGDVKLLPGDLVDRSEIEELNTKAQEADGHPATYQQVLLGITKASLETESLLSAASFQHTITVLARAAIEGKTDRLIGLKENVILGKLIPAGTGFRPRLDLEDDGESDGDDGAALDLTDEALAEILDDDLDIERLVVAEDAPEGMAIGESEGDDGSGDGEVAAEAAEGDEDELVDIVAESDNDDREQDEE